MSDSTQASIMRSMAWEKAKGELNAMRYTFLVEDTNSNYEEFVTKLDRFIKEVEAHGLQE